MSSQLRILGMASGLDTETMIKQLMKAESMKVDKAKQDKQIIQWQQDLYREIIGDLTSLRSTYFDILKPDTNMLSYNSYSAFDVTSSDTVNSIVLAKAGVGALTGTYKVKVTQVAQTAIKEGSALGDSVTKSTKLSELGIASGTVNISYNGTTKQVAVDAANDTIDKFIQKISDATSGNVIARFSDLTKKFSIQTSITGSNNVINIDQISGLGISSSISGFASGAADGSTTMQTLGMAAGSSLAIKLNDGSTDLAGSPGITINSTDKIQDIIDKINATGKFTANFDMGLKQFSITSNNGKTVSLDKDITMLGLKSEGVGKDAIVDITPPDASSPITVTKSTNNFTIDGMSYTVLQKDSGSGVNLTVTPNTQKAFDKIKAFIDKYNEIIDKVNKKIEEKKQYDYKPLTEDQKKEMEEVDINKWEDKAKEGLLKNDSNLQNLLYSMRRAFFEGVEGAGLTLKDVGLSTSPDTTQRGKIVFDATLGGEQKLKDMLATRGEQVSRLFMQTSTKRPSYSPDLTSTERQQRDSDQGILQRINDVLQDYVRTTRNNNGKKGILLEKAGIKGDFTEFNNLLYNQIKDKDKLITSLTVKLADKENRYYSQFAKLEQAMNAMNSQSSWLAQQLGGGA